MSEYITTCERAARAGAEHLVRLRGRFEVREKGPSDWVTEADLASQEAIRKVVADAFPDHDFLGEEDPSATRSGSRFAWHVDPLDGTTNYMHGAPPYCVSVALAEDDEVVAAAIYDPWLDECFTAQKGKGTFLDGTEISASAAVSLGSSLVAASFPPVIDPDSDEIQAFLRVAQEVGSIRRTGSAALNLAYVAAGRFDGFWAVTIKPWDVAAGVLLVREAGGIVTAPDGGPFVLERASFACAATEKLHGELLHVLALG